MEYYVYLLLDPTTFYAPFYVGKGKGARWRRHLSETLEKTANRRKVRRITKIRQQGHEPVVMMWNTGLSETEAFEIEKALIHRFGRKHYDRGGLLLNIAEGGCGGVTNSVGREKYIEELKDRMKGAQNPFFGKTHSDEFRRLNSELHKGKTISPEQREKISAALKGRKRTPEVKARMSAAGKGIRKSEEHKAKIGARHRGKVISREHREKLSIAGRGRLHSEESKQKMREIALARKRGADGSFIK